MARAQDETRIAMRDVYYNQHCWIQTAAMEAALELIPSFPDQKSVNIVDYGCAQGINSIEPLRKVVASLDEGATVQVFFEDTPWNDWATLSRTLDEGLPQVAAMGRNVRVFPSLIARGFYDQVIPTGSADLGFSWSSFNYLERQPSVPLDPTAPPAEFIAARQKALAAAIRGDLAKLLLFRAAEFKTGGRIIAAISGKGPAADTRPSNSGFIPIQTALMKMVQARRVTPEELGKFALFPIHEHTPEEIQSALSIPEVAAAWEVEVLEPQLITHPAWFQYRSALIDAAEDEDKMADALQEYATSVILNLVSCSAWYWLDVLKRTRNGDEEEARQIIDDLIDSSIQEGLASLKDVKVEVWYTYLRLKRKAD